jgi:hypothetical protein
MARRPGGDIVSIIHGTYSAYGRHHCRCDKCRDAHNERVRRNRADRLASGRLSHGTRAAYDCGCRCAPCRAARTGAYNRLASERPQRNGSAS